MSIEEHENNSRTPSSQYALACQYEFGKQMLLDPEKAVYWYRKAAEQTEASEWATGRGEYDKVLAARCKLGELYEKGQFVAQDHREAYEWYLKATQAKYPNTKALWRLGRMFRKGYGVQKDFQLAREWLRKAALHTSAFTEAVAELRKIAKTEMLLAEQFSRGESAFSILPDWNFCFATLSQRKFSAQLHAEVALVNRRLSDIGRMSVLAIGIDRFNQFKETFGSNQAAALEGEVGALLRNFCTRLVHMGEGKFFAFCIEMDFAGALARAERIFLKLAEANDDANGHPIMRDHCRDNNNFDLTLAIGVATTNLTDVNTAQQLIQLSEHRRQTAQQAGQNQLCPQKRPIDEYLAEIASLPLPTDEQIARFCNYVMVSHSWYKGSILQGLKFEFFLNPELGPGTCGDMALNEVSRLRSEGYLQQFGYLDYRQGFTSKQMNLNIPQEVRDIGSALLYPYMSNQARAKNIILHLNSGIADAIGEIRHPDRDLIMLLFAKHEAKMDIHFQASNVYDREKFHALFMLRHYEKKEEPLSDDFLSKRAEYQSQVSEEEMKVMLPWFLQIEQAESDEQDTYNALNRNEKDKMHDAFNRVVDWIRNRQ